MFRDAKRYCYRNTASGTLVWDYPDGDHDTESKASPNQDSVQDEVEMELSDTPPRSSPSDLDSGSYKMKLKTCVHLSFFLIVISRELF